MEILSDFEEKILEEILEDIDLKTIMTEDFKSLVDTFWKEKLHEVD